MFNAVRGVDVLFQRANSIVNPLLSCLLLMVTAYICTWQVRAETLTLPPADVDLVGSIQITQTRQEDTLLDVARRFDIGQDEIVLANPDVDRWLPPVGTDVVIPGRYILPRAKRNGIVLNIPEMRLYYFPPAPAGGQAQVQTYPVSIGRMDWATPIGSTRVLSKSENPSWRPPLSIREEAEANGESLPEVIPAGPDNPLGKYALRLALPGYLIHSTNKPYGVGMRVTHGCVRMYPEDIEELYPDVPVGTAVQIVDQQVKLGWHFDTLYIEVHPPLEEKQQEPAALVEATVDTIYEIWEQHPLLLNGPALKQALEAQNGIPVAIGQIKRD